MFNEGLVKSDVSKKENGGLQRKQVMSRNIWLLITRPFVSFSCLNWLLPQHTLFEAGVFVLYILQSSLCDVEDRA